MKGLKEGVSNRTLFVIMATILTKPTYEEQEQIAEVFKRLYVEENTKINRVKQLLYDIINRDEDITQVTLVKLLCELE